MVCSDFCLYFREFVSLHEKSLLHYHFIRYSFFGLKEALGFAPSWHLWLRYISFLVQLSLLHSILKLSLLHSISKLSLLHSISKLSRPNPSLPFLVKVAEYFFPQLCMCFSLSRKVPSPLRNNNSRYAYVVACSLLLIVSLHSSVLVLRIEVCRVLSSQADTLKLRPSQVQTLPSSR
ncbi:hypothetical protein DY000_02050200 [Brassica cretica]|uniref:Uncharacterized protein n=1 Tax=Brassica cretica TaxID=69181 RepID=A0ABQ7EVU3_BRACR|nr:hypothetical protein DY000_02050200 [Brassica cretica]